MTDLSRAPSTGFQMATDFAREFGPDAARLAMHSAVALTLSPDLVHLLRVNFVPSAPAITEADLLLSPLCQTLERGVFEMAPQVRSFLLDRFPLELGFGPERRREVARLIFAYSGKRSVEIRSPRARRRLGIERLAALAIVDPDLAATALERLVSDVANERSLGELGAFVRLTASLSEPLAGHGALVTSATAVDDRLAGRAAHAGLWLDDLTAPAASRSDGRRRFARARRALLIGSQTYGLSGCDADVVLMKEGLERQGFDAIDVRTGLDATRAGIIDGYEELIGVTGVDNVVVVYYSGHGGRNARTDVEAQVATGGSPFHHYLVPFDMEASDGGDFRGLLVEEVTELERRLTLRFRGAGVTPNITTVLDCCYSGYMSLDPAAPVPKALSDEQARRFSFRGIKEHVAALPRYTAPWAETDPYAVRLAACQVDQSAFERNSARGGRHGVLTDCLVELLDGLGGAALTWTTVAEILRHRVQALIPGQRPVVEGPADRVVFSTVSNRRRGSLPVVSRNGRLLIEAAGLLGLAVGDRFTLEPPAEERTIGRAEVVSVDGGAAELNSELNAGVSAVPVGTMAIPASIHRPRRPVASELTGEVAAALAKRLEESSLLAPYRRGDAVFATVVDDGGLVVLDAAGARTRTLAEPPAAAGVESTVELLELLVRGRRLAELESGSGDAELNAPVEVSFARIEGSTRTELRRYGEEILPGQRVSVRVTNRSDETVFLWLFDVGVSGRIGLITNQSPDGHPLAGGGQPGDTFTIWGEEGGLISWPEDVPMEGPGEASPARLETFVVILADRRQSLADLQTPRDRARGAEASDLDVVLDEARSGFREAPPSSGEPSLRYRVETIQFLLDPT